MIFRFLKFINKIFGSIIVAAGLGLAMTTRLSEKGSTTEEKELDGYFSAVGIIMVIFSPIIGPYMLYKDYREGENS